MTKLITASATIVHSKTIILRYDICGNGYGVQILFKSQCLCSIVSKDPSSLGCLRGGKISHCELLLKVSNLLVLSINLILAHLIENSLGRSGIGSNYVTKCITYSGSVCACFLSNGSAEIGRGQSLLTTT